MTSVAEWGAETTGTEVANRFDKYIQGKNILVTGVSPNGIGESTVTAIAHHQPAKLILASRTKSKLDEVAKKLTGIISPNSLHIVELDLSSQKAIRHAAHDIIKLVDHLDILINNAAVTTSYRTETVDGLELTFGTNHVGHFLLTSLLMPLLESAAKSGRPGQTRIVNVTSAGHRMSPIRFHDYNFEGKPVPPEEEPPAAVPAHLKPDVSAGRFYYVFTAYGQSKTANILHAVALNDKFGERGIRAFAVHPGSIWTELSRNLAPEDRNFIEKFTGSWKNLDQGAATTLVAAFDPALSKETGKVYMADCHFLDPAGHAQDHGIAERLWQLSEQLVQGNSKL